MLPVKKRFSHPDTAAASPVTKRPKLSHRDDFLHLQNTRMQQLVALRRSVQAAALPRVRIEAPSHSMEARKRFSYQDNAISPFANMVSPESIATPFAMAVDTVPDPPFSTLRHGESIKVKPSPLDLLSSVSTYVASARKTASTRPASTAVNKPSTKPSAVVAAETSSLSHGIAQYSNGCRYVGSFLSSRRHGYGKCWYPNSSMYTGQWSEGKRCGVGRMQYANGDVYEGTWRNDVRCKGIYYYKDGRVDVCTFEKNVEGCRWSRDRRMVWRVVDGELGERIMVEEGRMIGVALGVDLRLL